MFSLSLSRRVRLSSLCTSLFFLSLLHIYLDGVGFGFGGSLASSRVALRLPLSLVGEGLGRSQSQPQLHSKSRSGHGGDGVLRFEMPGGGDVKMATYDLAGRLGEVARGGFGSSYY